MSELVRELAPSHPRNDTFPGEVFLRIGADALDWCGASRADPVALDGMPERHLPECAFGGREKHELQFWSPVLESTFPDGRGYLGSKCSRMV